MSDDPEASDQEAPRSGWDPTAGNRNGPENNIGLFSAMTLKRSISAFRQYQESRRSRRAGELLLSPMSPSPPLPAMYYPPVDNTDTIQLRQEEHEASDREQTRVSTMEEMPAGQAGTEAEQGGGFTWFFFPAEIRNAIYHYSLHWPDSITLYRGFNNQLSDYYHSKHISGSNSSNNASSPGSSPSGTTDDGPDPADDFPIFDGKLATPTILLLCRRATAECLPILQSRTFVVDRLPPWLPGSRAPMRLSQFISPRTLQTLRHIDLRLAFCDGKYGSGWAWAHVVKDLLGILRERNSFVTLRVMVKFSTMDSPNVWHEEAKCYEEIINQVKDLSAFNPRFWRPGAINVEHWLVSKTEAHKMEVSSNGPFSAKTCVYPDKEIWPGSMMEFL